jgi:hypothetical protein
VAQSRECSYASDFSAKYLLTAAALRPSLKAQTTRDQRAVSFFVIVAVSVD